jgi:hypothetical protein
MFLHVYSGITGYFCVPSSHKRPVDKRKMNNRKITLPLQLLFLLIFDNFSILDNFSFR